MTGELEKIWKEVVVVQSRYHLSICWEELRKTVKIFNQETCCPS
jgi:hypothetical protein